MKKRRGFLLFVGLLGVFLLSACHQSVDMLGSWKVQDAAGQNTTIIMTANSLKIGNQTQSYKLNSSDSISGDGFNGEDKKTIKLWRDELGVFQNIKGSWDIYYYDISASDGTRYAVAFPAKSRDIAVLIKSSSSEHPMQGTLLYVMNKTTQPSYAEYVKKYLQ
jgi:hypothetical protein